MREATAEIERNFRQLAELKCGTGHGTRAQAHRRRPARRPGRQAADHRAHQRQRAHLHAWRARRWRRCGCRCAALPASPVRLTDALGDWRAEVVSRLAQAGIEGDWEAPDDLPQTLSARAYVQTTRILREATSNIIKHSNASALCSVVAQHQRQRLPVRRSRTTATASPPSWKGKPGPRPRPGQHEEPGQAVAGSVPRGIGSLAMEP